VSDYWALMLYERYVQLYGDPIEQPIRSEQPLSDSTPLPPSSLRGGEAHARPPPPPS